MVPRSHFAPTHVSTILFYLLYKYLSAALHTLHSVYCININIKIVLSTVISKCRAHTLHSARLTPLCRRPRRRPRHLRTRISAWSAIRAASVGCSHSRNGSPRRSRRSSSHSSCSRSCRRRRAAAATAAAATAAAAVAAAVAATAAAERQSCLGRHSSGAAECAKPGQRRQRYTLCT